MAINSFPKHVRALVQAAGFNGSLPAAIFNAKGDLQFANDRMCQILAVESDAFPLAGNFVRSAWPFSNDEWAGPKVFDAFVLRDDAGDSVVVETKLKTYKLSKARVAKENLILVVAELVRSGDLLSDRDSRQNLFRTLSHEIRTAVATFKGYTAMLKVTDGEQAQILARMQTSLERLENVVHRLDDFKLELNLNESKGSDDIKD